jgi:hypothetical protein
MTKKSVILVAMMAILGVATAVAQPRAIGGQIGNGITFSYEHALGNNFVTADLSFPGWFINGFGVEAVATYNWLNPFGADFPAVSQGDWNWYMGPGLAIGNIFDGYSYTVLGDKYLHVNNNFYLGAAGRFGVEYNFWFPLQLSVEWRPVIGPDFWSESRLNVDDPYDIDNYSSSGVRFYHEGLYWSAFLLGVRYKF